MINLLTFVLVFVVLLVFDAFGWVLVAACSFKKMPFFCRANINLKQTYRVRPKKTFSRKKNMEVA